MTRNILSRLKRVERAVEPPQEPYSILLIAADDPEAERLMAEHKAKHGEPPPGHVSVIVLTGVQRSPEGIVR